LTLFFTLKIILFTTPQRKHKDTPEVQMTVFFVNSWKQPHNIEKEKEVIQ